MWAEPQVSAQEVFIFKATHPVSAQRAIQPRVLQLGGAGRGKGVSPPCLLGLPDWFRRFCLSVLLCRIKHKPLADSKTQAVQEGMCIPAGSVLPEMQAWGLLAEDALGPLHLTIARSLLYP